MTNPKERNDTTTNINLLKIAKIKKDQKYEIKIIKNKNKKESNHKQ